MAQPKRTVVAAAKSSTQNIPASKSKEIHTGYVPRKLQENLHKNLKRFSVIVCHRRFGKSVFAINHLIHKAVTCNLPMPRFAYIAPTYSQAKRIIWAYLKQYTADIPGVEYNEAELRATFSHNGAQIMLLSGENYTSLKGIYLDGGILDEYADMNPAVFREAIRPTLSDRKGWCLFLGTPRGQNHFFEIFEYACSGKDPEWFGAKFKASETGIIDAKELASAKMQMTEEEYEQEYEVSFNAGLIGAYFSKELTCVEKEERVRNVPYDSAFSVDTYWDLGINDTTAVWFVQQVRAEIRVIDFYEICGASLPQIIKDIKAKPYSYGTFVLPHDAKARDYSTGKTQVQVFHNHGIKNVRVIPRVGSKRESINAARMVFSRCWFDKEKCAKGLKALANYQRKWNPKNNVFEDAPLHNWASNAADAWQQLGLGVKDTSSDSNESYGTYNRESYLQAETEYNLYQH